MLAEPHLLKYLPLSKTKTLMSREIPPILEKRLVQAESCYLNFALYLAHQFNFHFTDPSAMTISPIGAKLG